MYMFSSILIILRIQLVFGKLLPPQYTSNEQLFQCINKIANNINNSYTLIVSSNRDQQINYKSSSYLININKTAKIFEQLGRIDVFILNFHSKLELKSWLQQVYLSMNWNPQGKFIIYINKYKNKDEIINILWKYYIVNVYIILKTNVDYSAFTYFPYKNNCHLNISTEYVFSCRDELLEKIFPEKIPSDLKGCKIKYVVSYQPPFVLNTSGNRNNAAEIGIEGAIVHMFAERMNFTEEYIKHNFTTWGLMLDNGSYTAMYGELQKRNADIMFGGCHVDLNQTEFEVLAQAIIEYGTWWVPAARDQPRWSSILNIFHYIVWILILFSTFINAIIWWIFRKIRSDSSEYKTIKKCIELSWKVLLQISVPSPITSVMRLVIIFWFIFSILIYTAYQSKLISMLTKPTLEKQISTVEEMLDSGMKFGFYGTGTRHFRDPTNPIHKRILDHFIPCTLNEECANRTAFKRDFAVMRNLRTTQYLIKKYYMDSKGRVIIYGFKKDVIILLPMIIVRKGYPLINKFNKIILLLQANGIIAKFDRDLFDTKKFAPLSDLVPLSIGHVLCAFLILIIGVILSAIIFFLEVLSVKYYKYMNNAVRTYT